MTILIGIAPMVWVFIVMIGVMLLFTMGSFFCMLRCYVKTSSDYIIVRTGAGGTVAALHRIFVIPSLHQHVLIPITARKLRYERTSEFPLVFSCGTKATVTADLILRVNATAEDAERAISSLGVERLNDTEALREHFSSAFNCCLETIALQTSFSDLTADKGAFREKLLKNLGSDFGGMVVDDLCVHHLVKGGCRVPSTEY